MLNAVPDSWFSWKFTIFEKQISIAKIDPAWVRESGDLYIDGSKYRVFREGLLNGKFILEKDGEVLAHAEKPGVLFRSYKVVSENKSFMLEAESAMGRKFLLRDGDETAGFIQPENPFTRKAVIDLPEDISIPVRIFMIWLVLILWKRDVE